MGTGTAPAQGAPLESVPSGRQPPPSPRFLCIADWRRNGHESLNHHVVKCRQPGKHVLNFIHKKSGLALFLPDVDLKQNGLPKSCSCSASLDLYGKFQTIHRMNQLKDADHRPHFSPLKLADKMPGNALAL